MFWRILLHDACYSRIQNPSACLKEQSARVQMKTSLTRNDRYTVFAADYGGDNGSYGSIVKCVKVNLLFGLSTRKVLTKNFGPHWQEKVLSILFTMVVCD